MSIAVNQAFWSSPPWHGGGAKHRLGLRPVDGSPLTAISGEEVLRNKHRQLADNYEAVVACLPGSELAQQMLGTLISAPGDPPGDEVIYPDPIANYALQVAQDLCLIDVADQNRLVAACVCAPSYWRLADKIGKPLMAIHAPVEGMNAKIGDRIQQFLGNLPASTTFVRDNWFLHGNADLYQLPGENLSDFPRDNWVMRCEYQSLYRLSPRYVLFAIRIVCEPLAHMAGFPQARTSLAAALRRMDEDEVTHFGGPCKVAVLLDVLEQLEQTE